jgi:DNA-binding transcriptional MerR regulator
MYKIGEAADLAKVSIRLLRHYDEIGLLVPSGRSEAGYRLYSHGDLQRLQQILVYRTLEFPLDEIRRLMTAPGFDRHAALLQQRELIIGKARQLRAVLDLVDDIIAGPGQGGQEHNTMSTKEMFEVFPDMHQEFLAEAEQRWGNGAAWQQSAKRAQNYRKEDWQKMKQEMEDVNARLAQVCKAGTKPEAPEAIAAVDAARLLIDRWHYDCSKEFHANLTAMTSSDERFVRNIDRNCSGLAAFIHEAAKANLRMG